MINADCNILNVFMLTARKSAWFERIFALYNRNLFKRRFHSFRASGLNHLLEKDPNIPLIIYANHSAWWDGLAAFEISRAAHLDAFVMMEEKQLKNLFLFRLLGAFSVIRENPRDALKSVNYAAGLLEENHNRALWVFPQGEILPNDARPVMFYNGISKIAGKLEKCYLIPLAMRYEFRGEFKPEIYIKIGEPELLKIENNFNSKLLTRRLEKHLTGILDDLKNDVSTKQLDNYKMIL